MAPSCVYLLDFVDGRLVILDFVDGRLVILYFVNGRLVILPCVCIVACAFSLCLPGIVAFVLQFSLSKLLKIYFYIIITMASYDVTFL